VRANRLRLLPRVVSVYETMVNGAAGNPIVLKDPRLGLLLPIWDTAIGDELLDVLVVRNPIDIAASLQQRNGFPTHFSLALWHLYTVALLQSLRGRPVLVADFDRLSAGPAERDRWESAVGKELRRAGLAFPRLDTFSGPIKHFRSRESDLLDIASPEQLRLWRYLAELDPVEGALDPPPELLEWPTSSSLLVLEIGSLIQADHVSDRDEVEGLRAELQRVVDASAERESDLWLRLSAESERSAAAERVSRELSDAVVRNRLEESALRDRLSMIEETWGAQEVGLVAARGEVEGLRAEVQRVVDAAGERESDLQLRLSAESERSAAAERLARELADVAAHTFEELVAVRGEETTLRQQLATIQSSRSWRVTRPLRAVFRLLRRGQPGHS